MVFAMKKNPRIIIIGAGPCGLGAAWRLRQLGLTNFQIYEQEGSAGGLARSFTDAAGFTWDIGGHVTHSHYPYFDRVLKSVLGNDFYTHIRQSWVWIYERLVPYPFQNNIHFLPPQVRAECLAGLRQATGDTSRRPRNFREWIEFSFGKGIARHFLWPYNRKMWAYPPEKMNFAWVGDRVAKVNLAQIERHSRENSPDIAWGPNATFVFPKSGGTGEIWRRLSRRLAGQLSLDQGIVNVDPYAKQVLLSDGSRKNYDLLLSTMPLDLLLRRLEGVHIKYAKDALNHSAVALVGLGIKGESAPHLRRTSWIYYPQADIAFYRATVLSNYSRANAPRGHWSLLLETSAPAGKRTSLGEITRAVVSGARAAKLLSPTDQIVSRWAYRVEYGYPTPTLGRDRFLAKVLPALEKFAIYSRGRFGAWKYEVSNQDHTFMQGVEWVNRMLLGEKEITFNNPHQVNASKKK